MSSPAMITQTMTMTEDQITTWIAGLVDGEGSIILSRDCKDGSFFNIKVNISNTNIELLNTIKDIS